MNLSCLFLSQPKPSTCQDSLFMQKEQAQVPAKSIGNSSFSANLGFRRIKKDNESISNANNFVVKKETNYNPFNQPLPENMERILQMLSQKSPSMNPLSLFTSNNNINQIKPIKQETIEKPETTAIQLENENKITSNNARTVQLINELQHKLNENKPNSNPNPNNLINKSLYVGVLANLYNQIQSKKTKDNKSPITSGLTLSNILNRANLKKESSQDDSDSECDSQQDLLKCKSKKIKKMNLSCGHYNREHYAKNLCNNCYHKYGRTKKPWNCTHDKLYAHGLCQNCYINKYNQQKKTTKGKSNNSFEEEDSSIEQCKIIKQEGVEVETTKDNSQDNIKEEENTII